MVQPKTEFDLEKYLSDGVRDMVKSILKAVIHDPKETVFMTKYAAAAGEAEKKRRKAWEQGDIIPTFLIASVTGSCNLHCAGCYAREIHMCADEKIAGELTAGEWEKVFREADELGISFILLAGGEPMIRNDVICSAAKFPGILFPVFTNGSLINDEYLRLFDAHRNLIPVFSVEGQQKNTDARRGEGVYERVMDGMSKMHRKRLPFGASVTVTTENLDDVTSDAFLEKVSGYGAKVVFYVEFVPVKAGTERLAPGDGERALMEQRLADIRKKYPDMIFLTFPGDEKAFGGCMAAGRGFFHINPHGGAEPCPFSPFEDVNVRDTSLREAVRSRFFKALRDGDVLREEHAGGCVLFEKRETVERLIRETQ